MSFLGDLFNMSTFGLFDNSVEKQSKAAGYTNAHAIQAETTETLRRSAYEQMQTKDRAIADTRASGFRGIGGTTTKYLSDLDKIYSEEAAWIQKSGDLRASGAVLSGQLAASQATAQKYSTVLSIITAVGGLA